MASWLPRSAVCNSKIGVLHEVVGEARPTASLLVVRIVPRSRAECPQPWTLSVMRLGLMGCPNLRCLQTGHSPALSSIISPSTFHPRRILTVMVLSLSLTRPKLLDSHTLLRWPSSHSLSSTGLRNTTPTTSLFFSCPEGNAVAQAGPTLYDSNTAGKVRRM